MTQKLVVPITFNIYQGDALVRTETIAQNVIKIGRDQKSHLRIEDDSVSRMHAVIEAKPDEIQIIDLGSGTLVNGQSVNKSALKAGDEVRIGNTRIVVDIGQPVDASTVEPPRNVSRPTPAVAATQPVVAPPFAPPIAAVPPAAHPFGSVPPPSAGAHGHGHGHAPDGEEIYQLIKRGDINPHEVEEVGSQAMEVSVLWKNAILHVAHLDGKKDFVLSSSEPPKEPLPVAALATAGVSLLPVVARFALRLSPNAKLMYDLGIAGGFFVTAAVIGTALASRELRGQKNQPARFVLGPEALAGVAQLPVVLNRGSSTRFVFVSGSTGEAEIDGVKRSLQDLIAAGIAQPSTIAPGGHEIEVRPGSRYRMETGGLTIMAKVVAPGRKMAAAVRRDPAILGAFGGSAVAVMAAVLAMRFAVSDDSGFLSQGNDEDRLNELRAFIQRQQERQPEQQQQEQANNQQEGGTGTRHAGDEGKMGKRDAPVRNARYAIRNNGQPPQLSRQQAREIVSRTALFTALGAPGGGAAGGQSGIVSPFGGLTESGVDSVNANGNMTGDQTGDAFGYGGLGMAGTGWGGGGTGEGTIGLGNIGTMGHGAGTGNGDGYGAGAGRGLRNRSTQGPLVRAAPPSVTGLLSPEAIRRVVLRNLGQVTHCHEQGLQQNPNLEGRVVVRFVIGGTGSVMGSNVQESNLAVPSVAQCIANAVRRWQFPAPEGGGIVTVNYPFNLQHPN